MKGSVAIITGTSRGLGAALAEHFREEGAHVIQGTRFGLDVTKPEHLDRTVSHVINTYGRIDILVNNAAILGPVGELETNDWKAWELTIQTNLLGPVYFARACLSIMKKQRYGKIINICGGGASGPLPRRTAYGVSKAALARFTDSLAVEVKNHGIDVNAVLPGPMPTDMLSEIIAAGPQKLGAQDYEQHVQYQQDAARTTEKAVRLCAYLASPASNGVTGRLLSAQWDEWPFDSEMKHRIVKGDIYTLRRNTQDRQNAH